MVQAWSTMVQPGDPLARDFGKFENRRQVAVNLSIGSMTIHDDKRMVLT